MYDFIIEITYPDGHIDSWDFKADSYKEACEDWEDDYPGCSIKISYKR